MSFPMRKLVSLAAVFGLGLACSPLLLSAPSIAQQEAPFPASPQQSTSGEAKPSGSVFLVMLIIQWGYSPHLSGGPLMIPMLTLEGCEAERLRMQSKEGYKWKNVGIDSVCIIQR